jgi:hypothetical protein
LFKIPFPGSAFRLVAARKFKEYVDEDSRLKSLVQRAAGSAQLDRIYRKIVAAQLSRFSRVASFEDGNLIIVADNGATAAKLKQVTPTLVKNFRIRTIQVTSIRVHVQVYVNSRRAIRTPDKRAKLSEVSLQSLRELDQTLQPSPLREAVRKMLARHSQRAPLKSV